MDTLRPADEQELRAAVAAAAAARRSLEVVGAGSKRSLGRPVQADATLAVDRLDGILDYAPAELVITARAGTPLAALEAALAANNQMLAFEPPDWGALLSAGKDRLSPTIGGVIGCNVAGPRRIKAGAARDHFLGFRAVNGRGELFKAGGKVLKNVTGYDLCKLMAGSFGTLAVLTEVTLKVLPRPETTRTLLVSGLDDARGIAALAEALGGPHEITAAAHLPAAAARDVSSGDPLTAMRIEGFAASVQWRVQALREHFGRSAAVAELEDAASHRFWHDLAAVRALRADEDHPLWRISVAPTLAPGLIASLARTLAIRHFYDWAGGLVWLAVANADDAGQSALRAAVAAAGGGHATLMRAPAALRSRLAVFEPMPPALAALSARVKASFDPGQILNPGRMYPP